MPLGIGGILVILGVVLIVFGHLILGIILALIGADRLRRLRARAVVLGARPRRVTGSSGR